MALVRASKDSFDAKVLEFLNLYTDKDGPSKKPMMRLEGHHRRVFFQKLDDFGKEISDIKDSGLVHIFVAETVVKYTLARYDNAIVELRRVAMEANSRSGEVQALQEADNKKPVILP